MTQPESSEALAATVSRTWQRMRPMALERLGALAAALEAVAAGELSEKRRIEAMGDAHKLSGSLGTYGIHDGTTEVRHAEALLRQVGQPRTAQWTADVRSQASRLRFLSRRLTTPVNRDG